MEHHKEWTTNLAASAQVAGLVYQVLVHDMLLSFEPENSEHLKQLQEANHVYIQGMTIQIAAWLKKNQQFGKRSGSLILWIAQADHSDMAISKGPIWQYELKSTEIFRTGFRMM